MTPWEHYREAERLLAEAKEHKFEDAMGSGWVVKSAALVAEAQVHATLASVVSWPNEEMGR